MLTLVRYLFILPIILYQKLISPLLPGSCIYHPTCSMYARNAIKTHGVFKGVLLGITRIFRCTGVFFTGGDDPVPKDFSMDYITSSYRKFYRSRK